MNSELDAQRVKEIFEKAIEFTSTRERQGFVNGLCDGDASLLARVQTLLHAHFESEDSFLPENPIAALAAHKGVGPEESPGGYERQKSGEGAALPPLDLSTKEAVAGDYIGRYKLLQRIGEGGCGVVWMAEQSEPVRRRVALKVIKLGMDTKAVVARFEAERQALAIMDHPNIAKVHDAGATETGRPFFVMELVRGIPITKYCDENHLPPKARLELFIKVCQAVHHAHQKAIIHRDLKPSNILVTVNDGAPTPKIIDFGIAKATQGRLTDATVFTAFEQFIGTPVYMSPEQAEMSSLDIDTRSDIYSLGVLLYELLTGKPPLDPKALVQVGVDQIRQYIREVEPPTPSRRLHTLADDERTTIARLRGTPAAQLSLLLRGDLDWIIMRCLEKDRTRRYDTANGLAMDIQRHLQNEPVIARPPSTAYLLQKLFRRHRVVFAATVAIVVALTAGAVVSTWQAVRAKQAEANAETARQGEASLRHEAEIARQAENKLRLEAQSQELISQQRAYAADMHLVPQALANANITRARELLDRYRPLPGQTDLRGWEWRYLWQQCQPNWQSVLCEDAGEVRSLSISSDGRWLAVAGGRFSFWNLTTGKEIATPLNRSSTYARVVFASRRPLLAAYAYDLDRVSLAPRHRIILWNYHTEEIEREIPLAAECTGLFFSDDSEIFGAATLAPDDKIILWNVADGSELRTFPAPQRRGFHIAPIVAVAPDFSAAAHITPSSKLRVIDLKTGRDRWVADAVDEANVVVSVAFSADGQRIASRGGVDDRTVRIWDALSGKLLRRFGAEHIGLVVGLLFWPDGKTLATASADSMIRIWDVASGDLINTLQGHNVTVGSLALLPDKATLISGARDGVVSRWNVTSQRRTDARIVLPERIGAWRFAEDGKSLLTAARNGRIIRWQGEGFSEQIVELEAGKIVGDFRMGPEQFSPDLRYVALQRIEGKVEVWDTFTHRKCQEFDGAIDIFPVAHFRDDHTLRVFDQRRGDSVQCSEWDLHTGSVLGSWPIPIRAPLPSANIIQDFNNSQTGSSLCVTFSADGDRCLISNSAKQPVVFYDMRNGASKVLGLKLSANRFPRFSPDGSLLVGREGYDIKLWETVTFREVASLATVTVKVPQSVAFSPQGDRVAVGNGRAPAIILWNPETHESVLTLEATGGEHSLTAFSPDGNRLGSRSTSWANGEGILTIWSAPTWEEIKAAEKRSAAARTTPAP